MTRPIQRAGHIGTDDNRFCGAAVFGELAGAIASPVDLLARAFGLGELNADARELMRCMALCLTSPDARVWPLKLARTLASYGNPFAGFFGAQLVNASDRVGPGAATSAAAALAWIRARVGEAPTTAMIEEAVAAHCATRGRIAGFGVPFRAEDERVLGLRRLLIDHPATRRPAWRLHVQIAAAMRARDGLEPNIVFPLVALLLDLGLAPHRAGMFLSLIMAHTFAAHALEAADTDGPYLRELPGAVIEDRSTAPRRTPMAARLDGSGAAASPRRGLAW
jgi:hypothetical protein